MKPNVYNDNVHICAVMTSNTNSQHLISFTYIFMRHFQGGHKQLTGKRWCCRNGFCAVSSCRT